MTEGSEDLWRRRRQGDEKSLDGGGEDRWMKAWCLFSGIEFCVDSGGRGTIVFLEKERSRNRI